MTSLVARNIVRVSRPSTVSSSQRSKIRARDQSKRSLVAKNASYFGQINKSEINKSEINKSEINKSFERTGDVAPAARPSTSFSTVNAQNRKDEEDRTCKNCGRVWKYISQCRSHEEHCTANIGYCRIHIQDRNHVHNAICMRSPSGIHPAPRVKSSQEYEKDAQGQSATSTVASLAADYKQNEINAAVNLIKLTGDALRIQRLFRN